MPKGQAHTRKIIQFNHDKLRSGTHIPEEEEGLAIRLRCRIKGEVGEEHFYCRHTDQKLNATINASKWPKHTHDFNDENISP